MVRLTTALGRRYTIERELGRGGMGTVYLALDRKHGRQVAIKILPPDLAAAAGPERFLREIEIAARLTHPHILPLHDSGQTAGFLYYVTPFIEGESLRQRLDRGFMGVHESLVIATQVAEALAHAHVRGVVHRDVKPENILLQDGHAFLADFGVARAIASARLTDSGMPIGTPAYSSPEQAAGSPEVDGRSDIYSLGCVLYEMLVGNSNETGDASQILQQRFAVPLPPVRSIRAEVPEGLDRVLARALARDPAERYPSAAEFRTALVAPEGAERAEVVSSVPSVRRRRLLWLSVGASAMAIAGAAVAFLPRHVVSLDPKRVVVAGFENRTGDSAMSMVGDIAADYVARGLAATRLMHEVYDARATARSAGEPAGGVAYGLTLARKVGAGTVLWGSYYRTGDSLQIEAQLLDGATGKLIVPLEPSRGPAEDKTRVVEVLRQRVMAGFSVVLGSEFDTWKAASLPPTYEAYQEMLAGSQTEFDFQAAADHYRRAAALDTGFTGAQTSAAVALWLMRECAAVDSIADLLEKRPAPLPPVDRGQLRLAVAGCRGDTDEAIAATRTAIEASPRSVVLTVLGSVIALENLQPRASLEMLSLVDPDALGVKGFMLKLHHSWLDMTYHMLGDYQRELAHAQRGDRPSVEAAVALAGLGDWKAAEREALALLPDQHSDGDPWPGPLGTECVALELRAHGHPEAGRRIMERLVAWYGPAVNDATRSDFPCLGAHFSPFYYTGRWAEARAGYEHLLAADSGSVKAHGALGALALRQGDRTLAQQMDGWLAGHPAQPAATYERARLAALRGERDEAVGLLRHAVEQGLRGRMFHHLDPDFESLQGYRPYRALVLPDG